MGSYDGTGTTIATSLASTLILEPATNQWTPGPTMTSARGGRGCAAELADGRIIAILSTSGVLIPIGRNIKVLDMSECPKESRNKNNRKPLQETTTERVVKYVVINFDGVVGDDAHGAGSKTEGGGGAVEALEGGVGQVGGQAERRA